MPALVLVPVRSFPTPLPNRSFRHDPTTNPAKAALTFKNPNLEDIR